MLTSGGEVVMLEEPLSKNEGKTLKFKRKELTPISRSAGVYVHGFLSSLQDGSIFVFLNMRNFRVDGSIDNIVSLR